MDNTVMTVSLDMFQTIALAVPVLSLGGFLRKKVRLLNRFCIPAPVVGGLVFALISLILHQAGILEFSFDETLRNVCMVTFFTTIGFQANLKALKKGGIALMIFLGLVVGLLVCQNGLSLIVSKLIGVDPLLGLCTASIPMVGGHGTAGAFGPILEDLGLSGATTICTACATFGLIMGSLMGGPLGSRLIEQKDLLQTAVRDVDELVAEEEMQGHQASMFPVAVYELVIAMGIGSLLSYFLTKTGMTFPAYIGSMIVAAVIRNIGELSGNFEIPMIEIEEIGNVSLSLFLGVAMITLKLWQLTGLALPLLLLLLVQTILMFVYARFVIFPVMGKNYDSAIITAGTCGFGMGATPNAMANMQALCNRYAPSIKAFIVVPLTGGLFADFFNSIVITFFINRL